MYKGGWKRKIEVDEKKHASEKQKLNQKIKSFPIFSLSFSTNNLMFKYGSESGIGRKKLKKINKI
jgi:hypothetical protein